MYVSFYLSENEMHRKGDRDRLSEREREKSISQFCRTPWVSGKNGNIAVMWGSLAVGRDSGSFLGDGKRERPVPQRNCGGSSSKTLAFSMFSVCSVCLIQQHEQRGNSYYGVNFPGGCQEWLSSDGLSGSGARMGRCSCIHNGMSRGVISQHRSWYRDSGVRMCNPHLQCICIFFAPCHILMCCVLSHFSHVWIFATSWTVVCQAPGSMGFSRKEYWRGLPCPPPGDLPNLWNSKCIKGLPIW